MCLDVNIIISGMNMLLCFAISVFYANIRLMECFNQSHVISVMRVSNFHKKCYITHGWLLRLNGEDTVFTLQWCIVSDVCALFCCARHIVVCNNACMWHIGHVRQTRAFVLHILCATRDQQSNTFGGRSHHYAHFKAPLIALGLSTFHAPRSLTPICVSAISRQIF